MDVFAFRDKLITDYSSYISSFYRIKDDRISEKVQTDLAGGALWPEPLIQLNPTFFPGDTVDKLVHGKILHPWCSQIFRVNKDRSPDGDPLALHWHQSEAIRIATKGHNYVLTTGTGSGKSLAYIIPIVDHVLRSGSGKGTQAIVVYPMNALANSQMGELKKFIDPGFPDKSPVTFRRYTGQESESEKNEIIANPPDIILTNYVMLEYMLTRPEERDLMRAASGLRFLVLDELHTYRGRQGSDVALLIRRVREALAASKMQCVGTSATMSTKGTVADQRSEIARVASTLFGAKVLPAHVITERLQRSTRETSLADPHFLRSLLKRVLEHSDGAPKDYHGFVNDPLSVWIESVFGARTDASAGRLVRTDPIPIGGADGAAIKLASLTGADHAVCADSIRAGLLAGTVAEKNPKTGFPAFAFKLHQFISRGDTVYASLEDEADRYLTLNAQQYVPGDRDRVLLPLVFCRECGQEYYSVWREPHTELIGGFRYTKRPLEDEFNDGNREAGYLFRSAAKPWPDDPLDDVPEDWLDPTKVRTIKPSMRDSLPRPKRILPDGTEAPAGRLFQFIPWRFRFCLYCGVSYAPRSTDFSKLATLSSEGRSTATTVLSLSAIDQLRDDARLDQEARKLLSFTDNRQDASLQAGHFNDFVEIGLIRCALHNAVSDAPEGIGYESLPKSVFDALNLPLRLYAANENARYQALAETNKAMQAVLGYRLYRDLQRGWRITSPNLEQCGLLEIGYASLNEIANDETVWRDCHIALGSASGDTRFDVCKVLLDLLRRELAIEIEYLDASYGDQLRQMSRQNLIAPWSIDDNEELETAGVVFARSRGEREPRQNVYVSPRSGFGGYLRGGRAFPNMAGIKLGLADTDAITKDLLARLETCGLLRKVEDGTAAHPAPGYRLLARSLVWKAGSGEVAFHDPIHVPRPPEGGSQTNDYFVNFYKTSLQRLKNLEAREHTAQVPYELRQEREDRFREGDLPILFCSPTMELGVDIRQLNVVNLRNMPPTPANYAQRSGRAGRGGQPAFVFSYCATGSSHDQYFFKRPQRMVAGAVSAPRLDPTNEDLIRAHVHAIWMSEAIKDTGFNLGKSMTAVLDFGLSGGETKLTLKGHIRDALENPAPRERARRVAEHVLASIQADLEKSDWYGPGWLDKVLEDLPRSFDGSCERWRDLYRSAMRQVEAQYQIIKDPARPAKDKEEAKRLRAEAETQLGLLTDIETIYQSDFYSYRYFAGEGFLPGYNFPRLPLSAYIPARRSTDRNEFVSRARFLAISEFGPRAIIYHEGSRYMINKVILPVESPSPGGPSRLALRRAKLCGACGYIHPVPTEPGPDRCEQCGATLELSLPNLFRLQNVSTKRRERINSDEEERMRLGYEIATVVRFATHNGSRSAHGATVITKAHPLLLLTYGPSATLWRINMGEIRRKEKDKRGFVLDVERGYWAKGETDETASDDPMSSRKERVVPYVEDTRNCLLLKPSEALEAPTLFSLMAALKAAIQVEFQMEDSELAAEPLPSANDPNQILFYESAEGGAGVLRRLIDDDDAIARVARTALQICHFNPDNGDDLRRSPRADEDCEAACYDCLMTYANQRNHENLDRQLIRGLLMALRDAEVHKMPTPAAGGVDANNTTETLLASCDHDVERVWMEYLHSHGLRLPNEAHRAVAGSGATPDFVYRTDGHLAAIYVDGPTELGRDVRDTDSTIDLENAGYLVIRFRAAESWESIIAGAPDLFGVDHAYRV